MLEIINYIFWMLKLIIERDRDCILYWSVYFKHINMVTARMRSGPLSSSLYFRGCGMPECSLMLFCNVVLFVLDFLHGALYRVHPSPVLLYYFRITEDLLKYIYVIRGWIFLRTRILMTRKSHGYINKLIVINMERPQTKLYWIKSLMYPSDYMAPWWSEIPDNGNGVELNVT
jgi:hypothetical protein